MSRKTDPAKKRKKAARNAAGQSATELVGKGRGSVIYLVFVGVMALALAGCQQHDHTASYVLGYVASHEAARYVDRRLEHRNESGGQSYSNQDSGAGGASRTGRYTAVFPTADALPNSAMTPGALNPAVTQDTLDETICRRGGYTRSIRPAESYTERLKRDGIRSYGYARAMGPDAARFGNYEEDHLISLELGGSPTSPANLWPEPHHVIGGWGSYAKDRLENKLHTLVCRRRISLAQAQYQIAHDWVAAYQQYVGTNPDQARSHRYGG